MVTKWENMAAKNGSIELDAHREFEALTGDIIARTLFGSTFQECEKIFELIKEHLALTVAGIRSIYIPGQRFLPTKRNNRIRQVYKEVTALVMGIIDQKKKALKGGEISTSTDFLGMLVEYNLNHHTGKRESKNENMSIQDIIEECRIFYFGGQDTTSNMLSWTIVLLSMHPEWQERAREEIQQVLGDTEPNYDNINRLKIVCLNCLIYPFSIFDSQSPTSTVHNNNSYRADSDDIVRGFKVIPTSCGADESCNRRHKTWRIVYTSRSSRDVTDNTCALRP
jgi:cytochrome P450